VIQDRSKLKYTICFIVHGDKLLLLNRKYSPNMGLWNGVGGKLEPGETPVDGVLREVREETGIVLNEARFAGIVTWRSLTEDYGGMYAFVAKLSDVQLAETARGPVEREEGLLAWVDRDWALHPDNAGIVANIKQFLPSMLAGEMHEYQCVYDDNETLLEFRILPLADDLMDLAAGIGAGRL